MNINTMKGKSALLSGFLLMMMMGSSGTALAASSKETVDFTASVHVKRGTCALTFAESGTSLTYDFGDVSPALAMAGTVKDEKSFKLANCVGVDKLNISLSSANTAVVTAGEYAGTWIKPATPGATGVAFKTAIRSGQSSTTIYPLQADGVVSEASKVLDTTYFLYITATVIPTVTSMDQLTSGSLASTAVLNVTYM